MSIQKHSSSELFKNYIKTNLADDFLASIVVFLVALPLCMGIAIASGVPPILGLLSGIIGGVVVGSFAGSPLQVSGPAAGLAVMVYEFIGQYGLASLAPLGILVGCVQFIIFRFKLADYFRAISPALIKGLLSGIGLLILASQVHVAFDSGPVGGGLKNLLHIPKSFNDFVILEGGGRVAFLIALTTLMSILVWQKFAGKLAKSIPAPLFAIVTVSIGAIIFETKVDYVSIPKDIIKELNFVSASSFNFINFNFILSSLAIAFVASAETLLSTTATDKISSLNDSSNYNKEMLAQGLGNIMAGIFGALPITGVIVRSSANIQSGGKTRFSAIMHGIWLFVLVFFFTEILSFIPVSALAGILIYTGWKLLDVNSMPKIIKKSKAEALVYFITFALIVSVDLLTGVVAGFITSLVALLYKLHQLDLQKSNANDTTHLKLKGSASFLQVPKISKALKEIEDHDNVIICLEALEYSDWAVEEQLETWKTVQKRKGKKAEIRSKPN